MPLPKDTVANKVTCLDNGNRSSLSLPSAPNKPDSALLVTGPHILQTTRASPSPSPSLSPGVFFYRKGLFLNTAVKQNHRLRFHLSGYLLFL